MRIVVCDDSERLREKWVERIRPHAGRFEEIISLGPEALTVALAAVATRRKQWRTHGRFDVHAGCVFDDATLLIIDYDLLEYFENTTGFLTGDEISYLVRAFTTAGYVVVLNQFGTNEFDLKMTGDRDSRADLCVGAVQIGNPGLWNSGPFLGYRPWMWPNLALVGQQFERTVTEARASLDRTVKEFFDFTDDEWRELPASALTHLEARDGGVQRDDAQQFEGAASVTLRQYALGSRACLDRKDVDGVPNPDEDVLARVIAAKLRKWLARFVVPLNSVLIDLPHLLARFPALVAQDQRTVDRFSAHCRLDTPLEGRVAAHRFAKHTWLDRPAYRWRALTLDGELMKQLSRRDADSPNVVFAEDLSRFVTFDESRDFLCALETLDQRRFVSKPLLSADPYIDTAQVRYFPLSLLAT